MGSFDRGEHIVKRFEADNVRNPQLDFRGTFAEHVSSFEAERTDDGWKLGTRVADA
jgi:hypothetical protein